MTTFVRRSALRLSTGRGLALVGATLAGLVLAGSLTTAEAKPVLTRDEAAATVLANGFSSVAKAEVAATPHAEPARRASWNVWAAKDGIAYRVTLDGATGDLVAAAPAVEDD